MALDITRTGIKGVQIMNLATWIISLAALALSITALVRTIKSN